MFFAFVGICFIIYHVLEVLFWCLLDSDTELFLNSLFGKKLNTLAGKVIWVTGASSGIGAELAKRLAANGARVVLSARRLEQLQHIRDECIRAGAKESSLLILPMDVLNTEHHQSLLNTVLNHFGGIDILVNNAGRSQRAKWEEIDLRVDRELFDLDVFAVVHLSRIVVRHFTAKGVRGHIGVTSSVCGLIGAPNSASYDGAKHAIHGYFSCLKAEHPELDISLMCPGPVATEFLENCFTHEHQKKHGETVQPHDRRLTAERCAELMAIALANKQFLSYFGRFPISLIVSVALYYPNILRLALHLVGSDRLAKIRDSKSP